MVARISRRFWRGILGALLACLFAVPYKMGYDSEKYLRGWVLAVNQNKSQFQLELSDYQRHWLTSTGTLILRSPALPQQVITIPFTTYHGPLFINVGRPIRLGLSYFKGQIDSQALLGQQNIVTAKGSVEISALLPYFSDREISITLPPITLADKDNKINYQFQTMQGKLEGDDLLQIDIPSFKINSQEGNEILNLDGGLLRMILGSRSASFSAKRIDLQTKHPATLNNFVAQASFEALPTAKPSYLKLQLNLHFDQLELSVKSPSAQTLNLGPYELSLNLSGLQIAELLNLAQTTKTLSMQKQDLSPEQGEALEKNLVQIFTANTQFDLNSHLQTTQGQINAQFQGGLHMKNPLKNIDQLLNAFYSQGSVDFSAETKQILVVYDSHLETFLGLVKKNSTGNYSGHIQIHEGQIQLRQ